MAGTTGPHAASGTAHRGEVQGVILLPDLIEAGNRAVADGDAESMSGWVSAALAERVQRDRKLECPRTAIADYEAELGEITAAEIATQRQADREDAVVGAGSGASGRGGGARKVKSA